jgi:hypothetical protein
MKKSIILLFFFLTLIFRGQDRLGISNSNYASTHSIRLNPSSSVDSRTYMQMHLAGVNVYAKSNFAYLPNFNYRKAFQADHFEKSSEGVVKKFLYATASTDALSFVISKRMYGAGFFIRGRNVTDMRRVTYEMAGALLEGQGFSLYNRDLLGQKFKNAKLSSMTWMEYGVNFGGMIKREQDILVTFGGNLKYNTGINILYTNIQEFDSYNDGARSFGVNKLEAKVLRNQAAWNSGKGFGLDLGVTYKIMEGYVDKYYANSVRSNCDYVDYKCKIGLSMTDLGYIRFKKGTSETRVNGSGHFDPSRSDTSFFGALQYNFNSTTVEGKPILASLPTAVSGQIDWNFDNNIFLNITGIKNLVPTTATGVQGSDLVSVCPRVEFKKLEVALPLTFQKFIYPQLGLAVRYRTIVLGIDNVVPLVLTRNTSTIGIYFSIGASIFRNPACGGGAWSVSDCPKSTKSKKKNKRPRFSGKKRRVMNFNT